MSKANMHASVDNKIDSMSRLGPGDISFHAEGGDGLSSADCSGAWSERRPRNILVKPYDSILSTLNFTSP